MINMINEFETGSTPFSQWQKLIVCRTRPWHVIYGIRILEMFISSLHGPWLDARSCQKLFWWVWLRVLAIESSNAISPRLKPKCRTKIFLINNLKFWNERLVAMGNKSYLSIRYHLLRQRVWHVARRWAAAPNIINLFHFNRVEFN